MNYNYQAPPGAPGQFNRAPSFGAPPGMPAPPGMGAPPSLSPAPGVGPAPGMQASSVARPGLPPSFQPPATMPNINFSAPVIRLGTTGSNKSDFHASRKDANVDSYANNRGRLGVGADRNLEHERKQMRENMMALQPPTREEVMRTIFVSNITEGVAAYDGVERILRSAGSLRRWARAMDPNGKPLKFGYSEYEDAESLETAIELFQDGVEVPAKKQEPGIKSEDAEVEKITLKIYIDDNSRKYSEEWKERRNEDASVSAFRLDTAKDALRGVLTSLFKPTAAYTDHDGDVAMGESEVKADPVTGEIVTIPLSVEDELSDIPAEMRETVATEIAAFRERSNKKDMERLRQEEEREAAERGPGPRINRLASPPASAPLGPAGGANGIPLGPRDRGVHGAPSGPKGFGIQGPKDYQNGVAFVNGTGLDTNWIRLDDNDETDASDSDLELRRQEKTKTEKEKIYLDHERRWLNRERSRNAAIEREKNRDKDDEAQLSSLKEGMAARLKAWNDENEAQKRSEEYYADRSLWVRNRQLFHKKETELDDRDRAAENRENARERETKEPSRGAPARAVEQEAPREPTRFKLSLGAAAQKAQQAVPRRTAAEVEAFLEDEEEANTVTKRELKPIKFDSAVETAGLSEEERQQAARQLAADIPTDKEGLWKWPIQWDFVGDDILTEQLKPFVEKKIVEYLGVQEQMLVDVVEEHVRKRGTPDELVGELEGALDEEAEALVKKLWRMIIFFSESEKRGLST